VGGGNTGVSRTANQTILFVVIVVAAALVVAANLVGSCSIGGSSVVKSNQIKGVECDDPKFK
jgi:hypothetical protein